jgi:NAD(P)-dependent dehydrogenase (short-subunit alcohol dehydrogenase family)
MHLDFTGQHALITGGANGIGLATARALAAAGGSVTLLDLPRENPAAAAATIAGARALTADVTDRASLEAAFAAAGPIDILVSCAGIARFHPLVDTTLEDWNQTIAINLGGVFHALQLAARGMKERRSGAIVVIASTNSYDGEVDLAAYNASKAGILGLIHTAANELGPYGVRVNAVCPGLIRTRLTSQLYTNPDAARDYFRQIPLGRGGTAEEVAAAVLFYASRQASFITGSTLLVDGGQMATKFGTWSEEIGRFTGEQWELK